MSRPTVHNIPSRWLQGCMASGKTLAEAIAVWIEQDRLAELVNRPAGQSPSAS